MATVVRGHVGQRRQLPCRTGLPRPRRGVRFAQDYNGIAPVEPVQVEKWQIGAPPSVYDGPYWRAEWWARVPVAKRRGALRHTEEGERLTTSPSARSGGPGRRCPRPRWCAENWPAAQGGGGRAVQGEGRRDLLGHDYPGPGRSGGRPDEVTSAISCSGWKEMGMAIRHFRPGAS